MAKESKKTKMDREIYESFSNDQLALAAMRLLEEQQRMERLRNIIKTVCQHRMELMGVRMLPTEGPVRIKGKLRPDLTNTERDQAHDRGLLIKSVGFQYKAVVEQENSPATT